MIAARKEFVLRQVQLERLVNRYVSDPGRERPLRFTSEAIENIPGRYGARETYAVNGRDSFTERFRVRRTGQGI